MKTRDRILALALSLFNEEGYGHVTMARLASDLGIAEGNLWYHFKTKRDLMAALAERHAAVIEARLALSPALDGTNAIDDYIQLMLAIVDEIDGFRFIYRDQASFGEHAEPTASRAAGWIERTYGQMEGHLLALVQGGHLRLEPKALRNVAINATIIIRYSLEHFREMGRTTVTGAGVVRETLRRHITLFEGALDPLAARRFEQAVAARKQQPQKAA